MQRTLMSNCQKATDVSKTVVDYYQNVNTKQTITIWSAFNNFRFVALGVFPVQTQFLR